jgi:hypothetical protein
VHAVITLDDVTTWRDLLDWAWTGLQTASPWLSPLLWSAVAIALIVLWVKGKGWSRVKAALKWVQKAVATVDQVISLADDISYIKGQLQNNGGSTVKDEVQALGRAVARVERTATAAKATAAETQRLLREHLASKST